MKAKNIILTFEYKTRTWEVRRVLGRLLRRVFPKFRPRFLIARLMGRDIPIQAFNHTIYVDGKDLCLAPALMEDGVWEPRLTSFMRNVLRPGMTVVDIGANIGYFSILAAAEIGKGGKVFAFEPGRRNIELMKKNIEVNDFRNIVVVCAAVTAASGQTTLYTSETDYGDHRSYPVAQERSYVRGVPVGEKLRGEELVDAIALDDYFKEFIGTVNFIKMDIEGAEYYALQGMKNLLRQSVNVVVMTEFWPGGMEVARTSPQMFLDEVRSLGFDVHLLPEEGPIRQATDKEVFSEISKTKNDIMNIVLCRPERRATLPENA
ncbi:MAG: FkbM family methyltransferase [bacterium]|nr:FkbM family methyltransferase [bacterium]